MRFLHHNHCLYSPFSKLSSLSSSFNLMGSIPLCKSTSLAFLSPISSSSPQRCFLYRSNPLLHRSFPVQPMSHGKPFSMKPNGVSSFTSHANVPRPPAFLENPLDEAFISTQLNVLRKKLEELDIDTESCVPGQTNHLLCPMCKGGDSGERSFSLFISEDGGAAVWMCFRGKCGRKGRTLAFADGRSSYRSLGQVTLNQKIQNKRKITVESLQLEPLCDELVAYFAERLISKSTLLRNSVMQKRSNNQVLMYLGPEALKEVIDNAELYPIRGLFHFKDFFVETDAYYHKQFGNEFGVSTGWKALSDLYNVVPGELTIVTGIPNSGKTLMLTSSWKPISMAGRILIRSAAFLRLKSTSSFQAFHHVSSKPVSTFSNHPKISSHPQNSKQPSLSTLLRKSGFTQSQIHNFLSQNRLFLTNSNLQDIESSLVVLLSFKFLPTDLVSMVIDCPAVLDLEFVKKWEVIFSQIGLCNVSVSMIRSMLVLSRRFQLEPSIFCRTVDLLKRLGLSDAAVIRVLEDYPEIVFTNKREILRTIEYLMGIGIRRDEIDRIICSIPRVLGFRVDGRLTSLICEFEELGFDQNVISREIVREPRILGTELGEVSRCLELLRNLKCRNSIKERIFRDGAFRAAFEVKQRVDCLCKHGLIRTEAFKLLWKEPRLVTYEIENIEMKIDFLIHEMNFGVDCLIDVPEYLGINFEKQIVPRYNVIEYLESKGWLGSQVGLREIIKPSRLRFYNLFVKPYPECGKMFGKFAGDNETKSPSRHPIGLWKVFKPQRHPESKDDTKNMKSFMKSLV